MTAQDTDGARPKARRGTKTGTRTVAIRKRQDQAVQLRAQGMRLEDIAKALGYRNRSAASKAVLASLARSESESADELRALHSERLAAGYRAVGEIIAAAYDIPVLPDDMDGQEREEFAQMVADAIEAKAELKLKAVDRLVRLMEREARLHGLDAPVKAELNGQSVSVVFHSALQFPPPAQVVDARP